MWTPKTAHIPLHAISRYVISDASHLNKKRVYQFSETAPLTNFSALPKDRLYTRSSLKDNKQNKKHSLARDAYFCVNELKQSFRCQINYVFKFSENKLNVHISPYDAAIAKLCVGITKYCVYWLFKAWFQSSTISNYTCKILLFKFYIQPESNMIISRNMFI